MSLRGAATRLSLKTPLEDGTHFPDEQRVILYDCTLMLTEEEVTVARANLMDLLYQGNKVIFNQTLVDHPGNDNLRRQKKLNKRSIKARDFLITLKQKLDGIAKGINREWQCNGMSLLYSLPGCQRQLQHTDGVHGCDTGFASCLYTLDNSTEFVINDKPIVVGKNKLIVFHSTVMHGGGEVKHSGDEEGGKEGNLRIHAYLGKEDHVPPSNGDEIDPIGYYCECGKTFENGSQRNSHFHLCEKNPKGGENRTRKMAKQRQKRAAAKEQKR